MSGLLFVAFLLLLISHLSLRDRVTRLEAKKEASFVPGHNDAGNVSPLPPPEDAAAFAVDTTHRLTPTFTNEAPLLPESSTRAVSVKEFVLISWFKDHTLIKVGGILFFLGAAWFVSYAIKEGWIPPSIRILLGFILAAAAYVVAYMRRSASLVHYGALTALGSAIMLVSTLSGIAIFNLYPPLVALALVGGTVAYTVFVATRLSAEWLMLLAAFSGLIAPVFTGTQETFLLLLYLFVLSVGLLIPGQKQTWRIVTLLLVVGVSWHEMSILGTAPRLIEWLFVALFSALFFTAVTAMIMSTKEPHRLDVVALIVTSVTYVAFAAVLAVSPALAIFVATFVVAAAGYVLYTQKLPAKVIAVYLTLSVVGVLLGTSFLFSGYSLVLAYAIECAGAFLLATHLGLPERFVITVAGAYLLPLILSINSLLSPAWSNGVWHPEALAVYGVWGVLWLSALWLTHKPGVAIYVSSHAIITIFAVTGFFYGYAVIAVVMHAVFVGTAAYVMTYITWALLSLSLFFYVIKNNFPIKAVRVAALSILLPLTMSTVSLTANEWQLGVHQFSAFGVWSMVGVMCLSILLITQQYCKEYDLTLRRINGFFIFVTTLFMFAALRVTWDSLFATVLADVASYTSYAVILYFLVSVFILVRAPQFWVKFAVCSFLFPLVLSLGSFTLVGWPTDVFPVHVAGLSAVGVFAMLLAVGIWQHLYLVAEKEARNFLSLASRLLGFATLFISMGIVWGVAHSFATPSQAISIALFVYTVTGLGAYLYGTKRSKDLVRYAGVMLLTVVVGRLVLNDIWQMEILWRVITLLGIGTLFIAAAFFERSADSKKEML